MAMFLSRLKQALNLQSKTVTATTSQQTVTADTGYGGLSSVLVNPQLNTETYTPSQNTTNDMGAYNDYRYVDTNGMVIPSGTKQITDNGTGIDVAEYANVNVNVPTSQAVSILPSNSSPRPIYYGNDYHAEGNGYAIASYDSITPSSAGDFVSSGDIVKFGGSGVIIDSPVVDITPSNDTPEPLRVGMPFNVTTNGWAIEGIDDVIYPNDTPEAVSADSIVKISSYNGYVIDGYQNITPSSTPVSATSSNIYLNGNSATIVDYIDDLTPTSTPESVSSGDNIHFTGSGVIVDALPTPTSLTPSNSSPATITSGETYTATASGKAVASVTDITPSNSSPVSLSSGSIYKPSASGYAISSYSTATPSDSTPPQLSQGNIYEPTANGYLYATEQPKVAIDTCTNSSSSAANVSVTLGFKPKYLCVTYSTSAVLVYDERHSTTKYYRCTSTPAFDGQASFNQTSTGNTIQSINNDGFTIRSSGSRTWNYFAIG